MMTLGLLCLLLTVASLAASAPGKEFYVSASGKDTGPGTAQQPFASLERARDAVRALKAGAGLPAGGVTVWVAPGTYSRTATFTLEQADSGTEAAPVVYRGMKQGFVRFQGGVTLPASAFKPVTDPTVLDRLDPAARAQVRQVSLRDSGVPEPGPEWERRFAGAPTWSEVFFDHERMTQARWPNAGEWARVADVTGGAPHKIHGIPGDKVGRFTYEGDRPSRWAKEPELWLHGYWFWDWSDQRQRVEALDPATKTITLAPPYHGYGYRKNARYYALNALAELDSPGEWYVDRASWTLFFWPPAPLAGREVSFSLLSDPLVKLTDVSHVTFRGLTFEVSRGEGVQMYGGDRNLVAGCTFRNLARLAVRVEGGTNHGVQSCDLYNLGIGGISLTGGERKTLTPCGHFADNNHIHHFAQLVYTYQNGIRLNGVGCRMSHNLLHDTIHEALGYSGNDHVVEYNEVHSVCLEADDSGVIHQGRDWTWRGNKIRYNFFHDIVSGSAVSNMGVYLDDMECGVEVVGNVLYRIPRAVLAGGGRDNLIANNLIIDCPISIHVDNRAMNWAGYHVGTTMKGLLDRVPYREEPWRSRYPALVNIWEDEPAVPKGNVVRTNLMVNSGPMHLAPEVSKFGTVEGNVFVKQDPGFFDREGLDFRFKDLVAVQKQVPGFQPIPFAAIGLQVDEYRRDLPVTNPVVNPEARAFVGEQTVTLRPGRGAKAVVLRYTLDGSEPTLKSALYTKPILLTKTTTLKARAFSTVPGSEEASGTLGATYIGRQLGPEAGVYLSELEGYDVLAHGGLKRDQTYTGAGTYSVAGQKFERGLLLCPEAPMGQGHVTFDLEGGLAQAKVLRGFIGVDDPANREGSVTFAVEVFRNGQWERVFASKVIRKGDAAQALSVPIAGAQKLRLLTTDAGDGINSDHAVWAEAKLQ